MIGKVFFVSHSKWPNEFFVFLTACLASEQQPESFPSCRLWELKCHDEINLLKLVSCKVKTSFQNKASLYFFLNYFDMEMTFGLHKYVTSAASMILPLQAVMLKSVSCV